MAEKNTERQAGEPAGERDGDGRPSQKLHYQFREANDFRVVHVDGAWGGVRQDLKFHVNFYNDRPALPEAITVQLDAEDPRSEILGEQKVIRRFEFCALMDLKAARALRDWLDEHVKGAERHLQEISEEGNDAGA